jgi:hypothetical protein
MSKPPVKISPLVREVTMENKELHSPLQVALEHAVKKKQIFMDVDNQAITQYLEQGNRFFLATHPKTSEPLGFGVMHKSGQVIMHPKITKELSGLLPKMWFVKFIYSMKPRTGIGSSIAIKMHNTVKNEGGPGIWSYAVSHSGWSLSSKAPLGGGNILDLREGPPKEGEGEEDDLVKVRVLDTLTNHIREDEVYPRIVFKVFPTKKK